MYHRSVLLIVMLFAINGCGTAAVAVSPAPPTATSYGNAARVAKGAIPESYRCLPSGFPTGGAQPNLAYIAECSVAQAPEGQNLEKLAIALMRLEGDATYRSYCTGTPVVYDESVNVGFVVTAAHCVVGGSKAPATNITSRNITTYDRPYSWVYQGTPGVVTDGHLLTGKITAVYVPARYCRMPAFDEYGCSNLAQQDGDIAVLQVEGIFGNTMRVLPNLRLGTSATALTKNQLLMTLGYGINTSKNPNDRALYYVDYRYYAKDAFQGEYSSASLMNGYHADNTFYSIICQGDSGGGDFAWDGKNWVLVGDHSWGPTPCGVYGSKYAYAFDVSADTRPWHSFVAKVITSAIHHGCASLGPQYVCRSRD